MRRPSVAAVVLALALSFVTPVSAQQPCAFQLGFKAIADRIPEIVGRCLEDEHFNVVNGNAEQRTTAHHGKGGLLVWRKADNWTAYTDGHWSWVNGPYGLQKRLNTERFAWERDTATSQRAPAAAPREQVLVDMNVRVWPARESDYQCFVLEPGTLRASLRSVPSDPPTAAFPVRFRLIKYRAAVLMESLVLNATSELAQSIDGGEYCFSLTNEAPVPAGAGDAVLSNLTQTVYLRIAGTS